MNKSARARFFVRVGQAGRAAKRYDPFTRPLFPLALIMAAEGLLAGCATAPPPPPAIVSAPVTLPPVQVVVRVPCLAEADIPTIPTTVLDPKSDVKQLEQQFRADLDALRLYAIKADPLLRGCAKLKER